MHLVSGNQAALFLWSYRAAGAMIGCAITEVALKAIKPHTTAPFYAAGVLLGARGYPYLPWLLAKCSPSWQLPAYISSSIALFVAWLVCTTSVMIKLQGQVKKQRELVSGAYVFFLGFWLIKLLGWEHTQTITGCCSFMSSQESISYGDIRRLFNRLRKYSDISDDLFEALINAPISDASKNKFFLQLTKDYKDFALPFYIKQKLLKLTLQFGETSDLYHVLITVMQAAAERPDIQKRILDAFPLNANYYRVPNLHPETVAHLLAKPEPSIFDQIACHQFKEPLDLDACLDFERDDMLWIREMFNALPSEIAKKLIEHDLKNKSVLRIEGYVHFEQKDLDFAKSLKANCIDFLKKGYFLDGDSQLFPEMIEKHLHACSNRALMNFLLYYKNYEKQNYPKVVQEIQRRDSSVSLNELIKLSLFFINPLALNDTPSLSTLRWVVNNDTAECMHLIHQIAPYCGNSLELGEPEETPEGIMYWVLCNWRSPNVPDIVKKAIQASPAEYGKLMGSCAKMKERRYLHKHKTHLPYFKSVQWFGIQDLEDRERFIQSWHDAYRAQDESKPLKKSMMRNLNSLLEYFLTKDKVDSLYQHQSVYLLTSQLTYESNLCSKQLENVDLSPWKALPTDVVKIIFSFLAPKDLGRVGLTCKKFYNITYAQDGMKFWKNQGLGSIDAVRFMWKLSKWLKNPEESAEILLKPLTEKNISFVRDAFDLACPTSLFPATSARTFLENPEGEIDLATSEILKHFGVPYASIPHFCAWFNAHPTDENWQLFHKIHLSFPLIDLRAHLDIDVLNSFHQGSSDDPFL